MTDLPDLTIILGPQTRASLALNALLRENRQFLLKQGITVQPSRLASPMVRRLLDDRPERERLEEFSAKTRLRPAVLSAVNMFGPPQAGMMKGELFPDAEIRLAGLAAVAKNARFVLAIDPLPAFFLAAESETLEDRVRQTAWEVLYDLSWFELVREIVELLPGSELLVLTGQGVGKDPAAIARRFLSDHAENLPNPHVFIHYLISDTGHAVLERMLAKGPPAAETLAELYQSFALLPGKDDLRIRLGMDRVTGVLLDQRFDEDVTRIRALPGVEVI